MASLFGAATKGPPKVEPGTTNKMCHVFGRDVIEGQALFQVGASEGSTPQSSTLPQFCFKVVVAFFKVGP